MGRACSTYGRNKKPITFLLKNLKGRDHSEDLGRDGKIILEWILGKQGGKGWNEFIWLKTGEPVVGPCEHGNEALGSIKGKEFLDQLVKDYVPWS
jgi:hypothetical protein